MAQKNIEEINIIKYTYLSKWVTELWDCNEFIIRIGREYVIEPTKTNAGTRVIPMTNEVTEMFRAIIEDRPDYKVEKVVDGYTGLENARKEMGISDTDDKPLKQNMFKVI